MLHKSLRHAMTVFADRTAPYTVLQNPFERRIRPVDAKRFGNAAGKIVVPRVVKMVDEPLARARPAQRVDPKWMGDDELAGRGPKEFGNTVIVFAGGCDQPPGINAHYVQVGHLFGRCVERQGAGKVVGNDGGGGEFRLTKHWVEQRGNAWKVSVCKVVRLGGRRRG